MFKTILNFFKPFKPTPVEVKVEDTIKVEEPKDIIKVEESIAVVKNVSDWPFPTQVPEETVKAKPVKKPAKPNTTKTNSKQAPRPVNKGK